jgi:hypothetical protein
MSKSTTLISGLLALWVAASGSALAQGAGGGAGGAGAGGGRAGAGGGAGSGGTATMPAGSDMASGAASHKSTKPKSSSKMHKSAQKPGNDQTNMPGAKASSDTNGQ